MVGGMYAGLFTVQISTATEHIKCRQQVASQRVPTWEMTKRIAGEGGWVRGLNRGWVSCMIRDVPSFGVYVCILFDTARLRRVQKSNRAIVRSCSRHWGACSPRAWVVRARAWLGGGGGTYCTYCTRRIVC